MGTLYEYKDKAKTIDRLLQLVPYYGQRTFIAMPVPDFVPFSKGIM